MAGKGGKRPNAGRKPKQESAEQAEFMAKHFPADKREQVLNRMYEIAIGENAKAAVSAGTLLLAYAFGKPLEKHELGGKDGEPITVRVVYDAPKQ